MRCHNFGMDGCLALVCKLDRLRIVEVIQFGIVTCSPCFLHAFLATSDSYWRCNCCLNL